MPVGKLHNMSQLPKGLREELAQSVKKGKLRDLIGRFPQHFQVEEPHHFRALPPPPPGGAPPGPAAPVPPPPPPPRAAAAAAAAAAAGSS